MPGTIPPAVVDGVRTQAEPLVVRMEEGLEIGGRYRLEADGRVVDAAGREVPGSLAWVLGPGVHRIPRVDSAGRFTVQGIPPGRYEVLIRGPDGTESTIPVTATLVGEPTIVDLVLR